MKKPSQRRFDHTVLLRLMKKAKMSPTDLQLELLQKGCRACAATIHNWTNGKIADPGGSYIDGLAKVFGVASGIFFTRKS